MNVYVTAPSAELDRARAAMALLRRHGMAPAHDWPAQIEAYGTANRGLAELDRCLVSDAALRPRVIARIVANAAVE